MRKEFEDIIVKSFPKLFPGKRKVSQKKSLMYYGFKCGDGWFLLIFNLCREIQDFVDTHKRIAQPRVIQVKEKFNTLRFYVDNCDSDEIEKIINKYEVYSKFNNHKTGLCNKFEDCLKKITNDNKRKFAFY